MFKKITATFFTALCMLICTVSVAQAVMQEENIQMADGLRSNGKIYVVVAVLVTVLTGILLYIIQLDRKISKLEKS